MPAVSRLVLPLAAGAMKAPALRRTEPVRRARGFLGSLALPVGIALAALVVGIPGFAIWNIYSASETRRVAHDAPVDRGDTVVTTTIDRQVADDETEFVLRLVDGKLVRVIAARNETETFLNETLVYLDNARVLAHRNAAEGLDRVFVEAFATREADLEAYADWFFEWGRSWRFLYEAVAGAVQEAVRLSFSRTQITDAARHAVEDYLLRHYQEFVLKPGLRDPVISEGVKRLLVTAHDDYLTAVAGLDDRMQRFLAEKIRFAEPIDSDAVSVRIDWDAEKWKAPRGLAEDRMLEPVGSATLIGGGAAVGSLLARVVLPFFARTTAQVVASAEMTIGGATIGSIEPGLGTVVGALAGAVLDWGMSEFTEHMERDGFVADNAAALDATVLEWKGDIAPEIDRAIDVWFDDTREVVARQATAPE